ncbi:MAG: EF-P lysine aminoacylase EpmA [Proteobacteria bacterium]|nr:EF-P lysine aminoacylase EpmA [Pseudomonadota bacterium]MDA1326097.1 EF-P lysine aminoacylase EpmA [Pseudomonadota bacterium]
MNDTPPVSVQSPWWRPDRLAERLPNLHARNSIAGALRAYFAGQDFVEVDTPALQVSPGMEPHLTAFATALREPFDDRTRLLYLHTSPEFAMKMLLAGGMERIFQLAKTWRNAERSATHQPEFIMLEWYRAGQGWRAVAADCEALVRAAFSVSAGRRGAITDFRRDGKSCDPIGEWDYLSVAGAFDRHCGIDLLATIPDPLNPDRDALAEAARRIDIRIGDDDDWETIFFRLFLDRIEPNLGIGAPTILFDWPLSMAALARQNPRDSRVAERFEVFICGVELANGFGELTDAVEQRRRFEADAAKKQALYGHSYPIDEDFLAALAHGMPESAGIALGFDRLVMLCTGAASLEEVIWAPVVTAC